MKRTFGDDFKGNWGAVPNEFCICGPLSLDNMSTTNPLCFRYAEQQVRSAASPVNLSSLATGLRSAGKNIWLLARSLTIHRKLTRTPC